MEKKNHSSSGKKNHGFELSCGRQETHVLKYKVELTKLPRNIDQKNVNYLS
jgi:hypothetical protein